MNITGYFFANRKKDEVLYIPQNLIVIESDDGFDINYYPDNLTAYDAIWNRKRYDLINLDSDSPVWKIRLDPEMLRAFADCCFEGRHIEAHILAVSMFQNSRREVGKCR